MILAVCTDTSYLSKVGGKSWAAGHFYLTNQNDEDFNNMAILTLSTIIKHAVFSASKGELAALYYAAKSLPRFAPHSRNWARYNPSQLQ